MDSIDTWHVLFPFVVAFSCQTINSGEPVAFAHVSKTGVIDTANSKTVTAVTIFGTSVYCLNGLASGVTVRGGQATVDYHDAYREYAQFGLGDDNGSCPAGTKAFVWTADANGGSSPAGYLVVLYG